MFLKKSFFSKGLIPHTLVMFIHILQLVRLISIRGSEYTKCTQYTIFAEFQAHILDVVLCIVAMKCKIVLEMFTFFRGHLMFFFIAIVTYVELLSKCYFLPIAILFCIGS